MKKEHKQKKISKEVAEYNAQLEHYRKTGEPYLSEEDRDMDFSKVDNPEYSALKIIPFVDDKSSKKEE